MGVDDVGGSLAGPEREPISEELVELVTRRYGLTEPGPPNDLGGFNLNVRIGGHVARVYQPWVSEDRLLAIQWVRGRLQGAGIPVLAPTRGLADETFVRWRDRLVEVERYVDADEDMKTPQRLLQGFELFGRIHRMLADLIDAPSAAKSASYANHVEFAVVESATYSGTAVLREAEPTELELEYCETAERLADAVVAARLPELPRQLVHGDFWDNNVRFRNGDIVHLLDFDFMGERPRVDDLAITLFFSSEEFQRTRPDLLGSLVARYETVNPLLPEEREALPLAMARMPLVLATHLRYEEAARRYVTRTEVEALRWGARVVEDIDSWRGIFGR